MSNLISMLKAYGTKEEQSKIDTNKVIVEYYKRMAEQNDEVFVVTGKFILTLDRSIKDIKPNELPHTPIRKIK
jgi:hypothetical protein